MNAITPQNSNFLTESDLLNTILANLKRVSREYITATTEASNPNIRQLFTELTDSTLRTQGEIYLLMKEQNMYGAPSSVMKQELDKQIKQAKQTQQNLEQLVQQKTSHLDISTHQANVGVHAPNVQYP